MHGQGSHRTGGPEAADHPGSPAGVGGRQDGLGLQVLGRQAAGVGDGVVDIGGGDHTALFKLPPVVNGLLRLLHDAHHGGQCLQGILAAGGLAGEHDAAGAVEHRIGHIGHLRPGGPGVAHHGVQHLGGSDHRLARLKPLSDDLLLEDGHLGGGDLHPQVTPGHHDAVGGLQDLVDVVHALLILDLGDDADLLAAEAVQYLPHRLNISGPADKGSGNEVEIVLHAELDVAHILLRQGRQMDMYAGDIDALVGREGAAILHGAADVLSIDLLYLQSHQAVVNEDLLACGYLFMEFRIGDGDQVHVPLHLAGGQGKEIACLQRDRLGLKTPNADLRALGIQDGCHWAAHGVPHRLEQVQAVQMLLMAAMGKVKTGRVHAGADQGTDHVLVIHGGAQGADNFCLSQHHTSFLLRESFHFTSSFTS